MLSLTQCISAANDIQSRRAGKPQLPAKPTRCELISWLVWDDPNGCYSDEDMEAEFGETMTRDEAQEAFMSVVDEMVIGYIYSLAEPRVDSDELLRNYTDRL